MCFFSLFCFLFFKDFFFTVCGVVGLCWLFVALIGFWWLWLLALVALAFVFGCFWLDFVGFWLPVAFVGVLASGGLWLLVAFFSETCLCGLWLL